MQQMRKNEMSLTSRDREIVSVQKVLPVLHAHSTTLHADGTTNGGILRVDRTTVVVEEERTIVCGGGLNS